MDSTLTDHLKSLHTMAIDAKSGYQAALRDAEGHGLTGLFTDMITVHETNEAHLAAELTKAGIPADDDGSFMGSIHRTIMDVRALFGALGTSVLPGLIDGETRNLAAFDATIALQNVPPATARVLAAARARIANAIEQMAMRKRQSAGMQSHPMM